MLKENILNKKIYTGKSSSKSNAVIEVTPPMMALCDMLPFSELEWPKFERLLRRILQDVEGLRQVRLYGKEGQKQFGIDVIATDSYEKNVALQSKRYEKFDASDIRKVVQKFVSTERAFPISKLIIATSCEIRDNKTLDEFYLQRDEMRPVELELWDSAELSEILRKRPEIVIEFFGEEWAKRFCVAYKDLVQPVFSRDALKISEAVSQTPEVRTGAQEKFDEAEKTSDPEKAIALIEDGQSMLRDCGFAPYADLYEKKRLRLLVSAGKSEEAIKTLLNNFWIALDRGLLDLAQSIQFQTKHLLKPVQNEIFLENSIQEMEEAIQLYCNPLNELPRVEELKYAIYNGRVNFVILACEIALVNDDYIWLNSILPDVLSYLKASEDKNDVTLRLRLIVAEASEKWDDLLNDARKVNLGYKFSSLIEARHARYCALNQNIQEADSGWEDATRFALQAEQWNEAEKWIFNRRALSVYWNPLVTDELLPLQQAIKAMGASSPIFLAASNAYEKAVAKLEVGKLRPAILFANKALRDAVILGDLAEEKRIRRLVAKIYEEVGEYERAARNYARSEAIDEIENLGKSVSGCFINNIQDLDASNYWTVGTTYRLLSIQADLIPDDLIDVVLAHAVSDLELLSDRSMIDSRLSPSSRYNNAIKCLAAIVDRIDFDLAEKVLDYFIVSGWISGMEHRLYDEYVAVILAEISLKFETLVPDVIPGLVAVLGRSYPSRKQVCMQAIVKNSDIASRPLLELAQGENDWANEVLVYLGESFPEKEDVVARAFENLSSPLVHEDGVYEVGTRAIDDALLVRTLPSSKLYQVISQLFARANDPKVCYSDREKYLLAILNLSEKIDTDYYLEYYDKAKWIIESSVASEWDVLEAEFTHPLGFYRMNQGKRGDRAAAAFVAAKFAQTLAQKHEVKSLIYSLMLYEDQSLLARALYCIREIVADDFGFLMTQGSEIRSLVAYLWPKGSGDSYIGDLLVEDSDAGVRRSLAEGLKEMPREKFPHLFEKLEKDPMFTVRDAL